MTALTDVEQHMRDVLKLALLDEYEHGMRDAFTIVSAGLEASLKTAKNMPEAKDCLLGLEAALHVVNGLRDELKNQSIANTVTETNGEKSDG